MAIQRLDHVNFITHDMKKTIHFYCHIIGLVHGENLSIDTAQSVYFYIPGEKIAILGYGPILSMAFDAARKIKEKYSDFELLNDKNPIESLMDKNFEDNEINNCHKILVHLIYILIIRLLF